MHTRARSRVQRKTTSLISTSKRVLLVATSAMGLGGGLVLAEGVDRAWYGELGRPGP